MTMQETESEISHTLRMLKGRNPVRGVWFDMEDADEYKKNHGMDVYSEEDRTLLTDICIRFIEEMHSRGYITGVYANYDYYKNVLDTNRLYMTEGFNMWLAHWDVEEPDMDCMMWQFGAYRIGDHEFDGNIYYADYSSPYKDAYIETSAQAGRKVNVIYQAQIDGDYWLPQVINDEDYAGIRGRNITGITLSTDIGYAVYRVYSNGRWLAYVDSRNSDISDYYNGYAGNGYSIEAVEVYYYTPDTLLYNEGPHYQAFTENGYKYAYYRVSTTGNDYFPYQTDNEKNDGQDGYAGIYGRKVDRFQIVIK